MINIGYDISKIFLLLSGMWSIADYYLANEKLWVVFAMMTTLSMACMVFFAYQGKSE